MRIEHSQEARITPEPDNGQFVIGAPGETTLLRLGLAGAGALLLRMAMQVVTSAPLTESPLYAVMVIALGAMGLAVIAAAGWRAPLRPLRWLILLAVVGEVGLTVTLWRHTQRLNPFSTVDVALYIDMSTELAQRGENPYVWDFNNAHEVYRMGQAASTPLLDGSIIERHPYPALSFLAALPFAWAGLPGVWLVPVLAHMAAAVVLFLAAPRAIQPVILFPFVVWFNFSGLTAIGGNDIVWSALIAGMIVAWRRPTLRAVLYGLASSYKQSPWLLFPFLIIRLWRDQEQDTAPEPRVRRVGYFALVSGVVFALTNAAYLVWDPVAWLKGVLSPMSSPLVYLSQGGLGGLTAFGYVNLPKSFYLLATLICFGLTLFAYWRHYAALRDLFVVLPALLMWFSYRTLVVYWVYWAFPALAILIRRPPPLRPPAQSPSWRLTALVAAGALAVLVGAGLLMAGESPVVVGPLPPFLTVEGQVFRMNVRVQNKSSEFLTPRFGVHSDVTTYNTLPWLIESGPLALEPGQSAVYQISSNGQPSFPASSVGQVVVTDARGNYALRGVATIGPDRSFLWPDAIPNPEFLFWDSTATAPIFWGFHARPFGVGSASYAQKDGRNTVLLALDPQYPGPKVVAINSFILVPYTPFGVWVYVDAPSGSAAQYGIEFGDHDHVLTLRFGARDQMEQVSDGHVMIERAVPVGVWSYQEIDLIGLYRQAGWEPPPFQPLEYRRIDADFRAVDMSFFLTSDGTADEARVHFGPIEQAGYKVRPETLMAETLSDPAGYYVRLAERYVAERNYTRALDALERAQGYAPSDVTISSRIDEIYTHLEGENRR